MDPSLFPDFDQHYINRDQHRRDQHHYIQCIMYLSLHSMHYVPVRDQHRRSEAARTGRTARTARTAATLAMERLVKIQHQRRIPVGSPVGSKVHF
jgi:hypothetical protein